MKKVIRISVFAFGVILILGAICTVNMLRKTSRQIHVAPIVPVQIDEDAVAQRLGAAVRMQTVSSRDDASLNAAQFHALHALLEKQFPRVHRSLKREVVNGLSLLYTWQGSDANVKPILLMAHQDVVPIAPGTERDWQAPPFSGAIKDGAVWGRGAWDDKGNLMAQLEAVEQLLAEGYTPAPTIYLAYGADEEVNGFRGAAQIAELLKARGVRLAFVLDEGLLILDGVLKGLAKPVALIGVAEKGYLSLKLTVNATPGHSSMPPAKGTSAIAMASRALTALDEHPLPGGIGGVAAEMFAYLAPEMSGFSRFALSNLWLFGPLVERQLAAAANTNATLRTTTALTIINAGNKENVLPGRAEAIINFRLLPGDTIHAVLEHAQHTIGKSIAPENFKLDVLPGAVEASPVSPTSGAPFALVTRTVREVFPDAVVSPGLMVAATDSVRYQSLTEHIFKFSPIRVQSNELSLFHGTNERLPIKTYANAIRFYRRLLAEAAKR